MNRVKNEVKLYDRMYEIKVIRTGDKMTYDGIEYFDTIQKVGIFYNGHLVAMYDLDKCTISWRRNISNVAIAKLTVEVVNNYLGYDYIKVPTKLLKGFSDYMEEIDPDCNMSDVDLGAMYALHW